MKTTEDYISVILIIFLYVAVGSPKPPKGNQITDGTQNSSIGEK